MLLLHNMISQYQLSEALQIQTKHPEKKLGEILTEMGAINRRDIGTLLEAQRRWRSKGPAHKDVLAAMDWASDNTESVARDVAAMCDELLESGSDK